MGYTLIATSSGLTSASANGTTSDITLPSGVDAVAGARLRGAVLNRIALLVNAFSKAIFVDINNTAYPAQLATPAVKPTLAASGTGYTGTVRGKVQFLIKDIYGNVLGASELSPASDAVAFANQGIAWSGIAVSPDPAVNARRLYRTATLGTEFFWDVDIDDNTTTSITNSNADATLDLTAVDSGDYAAAPAGLDLVVEHGGRAWGRSKADPDTLYGSAVDDVTNWPEIIPTYPVGAEGSGITGLANRRDDLLIFKRKVIRKLIGDSEDNYAIKNVAEGFGCIAPDSVVVINDIVYWLDHDGVYMLDAQDLPKSLTDDTVRPWFTSTDYFARGQFSNAFGAYDPRTHAYVLFLCSAGSTTIDRYISLDILSGRWFGPHKLAAFTPSGAVVVNDASGNPQLAIGASNGFLYATLSGNYSDGSSTAIDFDIKGKFHSGEMPDYTHVWLQPSVFTKKESAGTLTVTPYVGQLDASAGTAQSHDLTKERERLARLGTGRLCQLEFQQATAGQGVELYGYEVPYIQVGRR
jgi:hypothetical protein